MIRSQFEIKLSRISSDQFSDVYGGGCGGGGVRVLLVARHGPILLHGRTSEAHTPPRPSPPSRAPPLLHPHLRHRPLRALHHQRRPISLHLLQPLHLLPPPPPSPHRHLPDPQPPSHSLPILPQLRPRPLRRISATGTMIRALIIDMFCSTALPLASEQGIPVYYFFTSGAAALAAYLHMPAIHRKEQGRVFKDSPDLLIEIPGLPAIPATEMPEPLLDARDPAYAEMLYFCESFLKSKGILVNTFDELEPVTMAAIAGGACVPDGPTPPVYNIGPLILDSQDAHKSSSRHETLSWLDSQPSGSVVFLCFGSRGRFTTAQTKAIAEGLERSGLRFMWVVKEDLDLAEEGFLTKVGLGVVIKGWAPQVDILSHESVGAFVTHCGWNSILEAVIAGKSMLAWPLYAEQHLNRAALVTTMGMAAPVLQHRGDFFVTGDELASSLTQLVTASPAGYQGKCCCHESKGLGGVITTRLFHART